MKVWGAVRLCVTSGVAEQLLGLLSTRTLGAEHRTSGPGSSELVIYLESPEAATDAAGWIARELSRRGLTAETTLETVRVPDEGWVELYQRSLVPFELGSGFTVYPKGHTEGEPPRATRALLIEPGQAFGTGEHPTTRLCVAELERLVRPGSRWLDLGCGTGILSLVARGCGAAVVRAVDHDPVAVEVARRVVAAHSAGGVEVVHGTTEQAGDGWDGAVVNILAPFFLAEAEGLTTRLRPGGVLVASGLLVEQTDAVVRALGRAGCRKLRQACEGEWAVIVLERSRDPEP